MQIHVTRTGHWNPSIFDHTHSDAWFDYQGDFEVDVYGRATLIRNSMIRVNEHRLIPHPAGMALPNDSLETEPTDIFQAYTTTNDEEDDEVPPLEDDMDESTTSDTDDSTASNISEGASDQHRILYRAVLSQFLGERAFREEVREDREKVLRELLLVSERALREGNLIAIMFPSFEQGYSVPSPFNQGKTFFGSWITFNIRNGLRIQATRFAEESHRLEAYDAYHDRGRGSFRTKLNARRRTLTFEYGMARHLTRVLPTPWNWNVNEYYEYIDLGIDKPDPAFTLVFHPSLMDFMRAYNIGIRIVTEGLIFGNEDHYTMTNVDVSNTAFMSPINVQMEYPDDGLISMANDVNVPHGNNTNE